VKDPLKDYFNILMRELKETAYQTMEKNEKETVTLYECIDFWVDTIRPIMDKWKTSEYEYLAIQWMSFLYKELNQVLISSLGGAYLDAVRTLRSIFETLIHVYSLELRHVDKPRNERWNALSVELDRMEKKRKTFTSKFINELPGFSAGEKSHLHKLYEELSSYTHPSIRHLEMGPPTSILFNYDPEMLRVCAQLSAAVTDLMFAVALQLESKFRDGLNEATKCWMKKLGMDFSLARLEIPQNPSH